ncbi:uncharacterized protein Z519_07169 [Cladophialophora bantiana CBS 173.52]|uniref:C2H2-type domain-containing protein n=1 Tax=Cladophialophora bantiana (strain ATCC 10958 / CBS 173.52 / CDC B-1940 / NIH 8579) TaxID=1442370 RepID=A0A0D2HMZ7_CLAB1|nr:uncharacterized protein Z519_07169 [Cladophialophora bantiana CBS 173.52]KIW92185.1 hypothetical protein Z519_07169 [Cladophialophora bantiana CBS 173.52]
MPRKACSTAESTYSGLQELRQHYHQEHGAADILHVMFLPCPLCSQKLDSELRARFKHIGRHMEDIAFAVVPHQYVDWEFYSESATSSDDQHERADADSTLQCSKRSLS